MILIREADLDLIEQALIAGRSMAVGEYGWLDPTHELFNESLSMITSARKGYSEENKTATNR